MKKIKRGHDINSVYHFYTFAKTVLISTIIQITLKQSKLST